MTICTKFAVALFLLSAPPLAAPAQPNRAASLLRGVAQQLAVGAVDAAAGAADVVPWDSLPARALLALLTAVMRPVSLLLATLPPLAHPGQLDSAQLSTRLFTGHANLSRLEVEGLDTLGELSVQADDAEHVSSRSSFAMLRAALTIDAEVAPRIFGGGARWRPGPARAAASFFNVSVVLRWKCGALSRDVLVALLSGRGRGGAADTLRMEIADVRVALDGPSEVTLSDPADASEAGSSRLLRTLHGAFEAQLRRTVEAQLAAALFNKLRSVGPISPVRQLEAKLRPRGETCDESEERRS